MPRNQTPDTEQPDDFSFGPGDRAVLEGPATALYQAAVEEDGVADNDQRVKDEPEAVQLLMRLGLFVHDTVTGTYAPRDPVGSQAQVITPLGQQGAELIAESSRWAQAYGRLGHAWRRSPASVHPPFTEIRGACEFR